MHGNVWEWCADGQRSYTASVITDPCGAIGEQVDRFAVRGGSWIRGARVVRSAQRFHWLRDFRGYYLGFRFVLRFTGAGGHGK